MSTEYRVTIINDGNSSANTCIFSPKDMIALSATTVYPQALGELICSSNDSDFIFGISNELVEEGQSVANVSICTEVPIVSNCGLTLEQNGKISTRENQFN